MGRRGWWVMLLVLAAVGWAAHRVYWVWRERRYDAEIVSASQRYGVDPALVKAVIWQESRFDARARGRAGEVGLMQLQETAARQWADAEKVGGFSPAALLDARTNTLAGAYYLAFLLHRYAATDDPRPYALADYNAGRSRVLQWEAGAGRTNASVFRAQIRFPGTRRYVEAVLRRCGRYEGLGVAPGH